MLASMLVAVIPASAATVTTESTDKPLKFRSGLNNVWSTEKKMTVLPKTLEATIEVPATSYDIFEGQILAFYTEKNDGHFIFVDVIRKNSTHGDYWDNLGVRVIFKNGTTEVQKVFYESLNAHVGKKTHNAVTFDNAINLYINGEHYTGASYFRNAADDAAALSVYNSIDLSNLPALSICGDDRAADSSYTKTNFPNYRYFKGGLYNAAIFSDVRSASEVKADAAAFDTSADNLIAAYNTANMAYNEREIVDLTGNGYNAKRTFRGKSFKSGFNNLYSSSKQVDVLPKTFEATIELPQDYSDQDWGNIFAWGNYSSINDEII